MIAQALGHAACRRGYSVVFTKTSRLLADLAGGHADRSWETRLARWARPSVLILDDFAMRDFTLAQADDLYEVVTERGTKSADLHRQPSSLGLVHAVPQSGGGRVDPRPHRQLGPPRPHGRQVLPAQQAARSDTEGKRQVSAERICAADGCENPVVRSRRPGRPAIYCSPDCRPSRIAGPGPAVAVEVAQDDEHDDDGITAGRNWVVRLQRGHDSVTIGRDLGRFSARRSPVTYAACSDRPRQGGGAIE